jgi:tetratricopeptide (TPR) repeat protein
MGSGVPEKPLGKLFISYSRRNRAQVYPFAETLSAAGIEVWIDREEIDPLDDFPARIREGIAQCHALLAWYSPEYAQSTYCQKELTAAWICAQRLTRNVLSRILIVNPEDSVEHIALGDVEKQNYLTAPKDGVSQAASIHSIQQKLAGLSGDFAAVKEFKPPAWHPDAQQGSGRFVGRLRELWAIHTALNPVGISELENANVVAQLRGLGGIGKTLLAIEYAKRFSASYPRGIHWLWAYGFDPNKPMDPKERERERRTQVENMALGYDISIRGKDSREIRRDLGRKLASGAPYLWVVDDLPPDLNTQEAFPSWCAPSANGCTLITTRSKDYEGKGPTITVDVLDPEPALELLTHERKPQTEGEREDAKGLAEDLGRHALALEVAGHFLLKSRDFATLRSEVTQEGSENDPLGVLAAGLKGQLPGGHEKSIVATLLASVRQLGDQGLSLMRLAGELQAGAPIPLRLAKDVFKRAFGLEKQAAEDYLALAVNQSEMNSLIAVSYGGVGGDALSLHPLVHYTMQHGDPAESEAPALRHKLREAAVWVLVDVFRDMSDIRKHMQLAPHVAHARYLILQPHTIEEALLSVWIAQFEGQRGNYREALEIERKALPILERLVGRDHPATLETRNNIASCIGQMGQADEAVHLFQELLPDVERVLGHDHPATLTTRNNIADYTRRIGQADEALRLFQVLLPDVERVLGRDHPVTLTTRSNIASCTMERGQADEALRLLQELLPDRERVLGRDHPDTLTTRNNIASCTMETGQADQALSLYRELLADQKRVLGPDHPDTLTTRSNIAFCIGETGQTDEALRQFQELLPDQERVLGRDHPDTLTTRNNIAYWTGETGQADEALSLYRELLPDRERVLGRYHPDTLTTRTMISSLEQGID